MTTLRWVLLTGAVAVVLAAGRIWRRARPGHSQEPVTDLWLSDHYRREGRWQ